jgi:DNA-binding NarL/FixJ family response regulator
MPPSAPRLASGEAGCAESALTEAARLRPDAILLDVQLGHGGNGFEVARALRRSCPEAAVLLVSSCDYGGADDLLRNVGAAGFTLKSGLLHENLATYWPARD